MIQFKGSDIIYSFRYGGVISHRFLVLLYAIFGILFVGLLSGFIATFIEYAVLNTDGVVMLCLAIAFAIFFSIFLIYDVWYRHIEKKYLLWLTDENLIEDVVVPFEYSMQDHGRKVYRFGVKFNIGDKQITRISKNFDGFYALHTQEMHIIYSPKFDEIMVLKE